MPSGVRVQLSPSAPLINLFRGRLMVGQQTLDLFIMVRIHAPKQGTILRRRVPTGIRALINIMNIHAAKFIKGIIGTDEILYNGKFQVAFLGRSNVGKSTLINSLTKNHHLARSSSTPGKTIRMDFFLINEEFYFVDFPGVGYAKRSFDKREKLSKMILWYLLYSEVKNRLAVLIIDAKVGITKFDLDLLKTFHETHINYIIVANKVDNLKESQKEKQLAQIRLGYKNAEIIPFSSKLNYGREQLMERISAYMTTNPIIDRM